MARFVTAAALAAATLAGPAWAQLSPAEIGRLNVLEQQQDLARLNALTAQAELRASQDRLRTQQALGSLSANRAASPSSLSGPPLSTQPLAPPAANPAADTLGSEMERLTRATDALLAQSNARLRAIKPASGN